MTSQIVEQIGIKTNETIEKIHLLFIQLRLLLTNPENINEISSPILILNELTNICNSLNDRKSYLAEDVLIIFENLLKNYFLLLDSYEFIDIIARHYSLVNNNFINSFYHLLDSSDIAIKISMAKYKARMAIFSRLLDQISSSTRIISFLKFELLNTSNNDQDLQRIIDNTCRIILMRILPILAYTDVISIKLSVIKLKKYENTFLNLLIRFIEKHFSENKPSENEILIQEILNFLYMISKQPSTIPILINIECPISCLQWLSLPFLKGKEYQSIILILKNIARHDEGIIILKEHKSEDIFTKFIKEILYTKIDYIIDRSMFGKILFIFNMIFLSIENQSTTDSIQNCNLICNSLISAIRISLSVRSFMFMEFYTSELLIILMKLFTNDNIVNYIIQNYANLEFFYDALKTIFQDTDNHLNRIMHGDEILLSIIALGNIFWSISFQDQYKQDLIKNIELITRCQLFIDCVISHTFLSRQIFSLKRAIDGIKQNLYPLKPTTTISTTHSLMISYSYLDMNFHRKFYEILSKHSKLSICTDADNWKQIAQNIEQADIILFLISNNFFMNKSCRQELIYVRDILEKPCILIYIDQIYKPIGWLHERIDTLKSIHFNEEEDFMNTCNELLIMINQTLSIEENSLDMKQWNDKEVKQWFTNYNLIPELHEFYQFQNGNELFLYAQAISTYPWTKEYERIKSRFEKKFQEQEKSLSPHEFLKFINALERIRY